MRQSQLEADIDREELGEERVKLDLDQVRQERRHQQQEIQSAPITSMHVEGPPQSVLGKAISEVLFNPEIPHSHHVDARRNCESLIRQCEKLPIGESLPKHSVFFRKSKYHFSSESELAVVVMKNMEQLEAELEAKRDWVPVRYESDIIQAVAQSRKQKSRRKHKGETIQATQAEGEEEDLDMFGGFTVSASAHAPGEIDGPIFKEVSLPVDDDIHALRSTLRARGAVAEPTSEDSGFGKKLDISKFANDEPDNAPKHKKRKENELFQKVMKRLDT